MSILYLGSYFWRSSA